MHWAPLPSSARRALQVSEPASRKKTASPVVPWSLIPRPYEKGTAGRRRRPPKKGEQTSSGCGDGRPLSRLTLRRKDRHQDVVKEERSHQSDYPAVVVERLEPADQAGHRKRAAAGRGRVGTADGEQGADHDADDRPRIETARVLVKAVRSVEVDQLEGRPPQQPVVGDQHAGHGAEQAAVE